MTLARVHDYANTPSPERMLSGSMFWVAPHDALGRQRIKQLRRDGHDIASLGNNAYRCKGQRPGRFNLEGRLFLETAESRQYRYRHIRQGYKFQRVERGVYRCVFKPPPPVAREKVSPEELDRTILSGTEFGIPRGDRPMRARIGMLRTKGYEIVSLGRSRFRCMNPPEKGISQDNQ